MTDTYADIWNQVMLLPICTQVLARNHRLVKRLDKKPVLFYELITKVIKTYAKKNHLYMFFDDITHIVGLSKYNNPLTVETQIAPQTIKLIASLLASPIHFQLERLPYYQVTPNA